MSTPSWSFSRIKSFEQCPKQFYHLKVVKDYVEPETKAMFYGTSFHTAAEEYVRDGAELPPQFAYAQDVLDSLNNKEGDKLCEYRMGLTKDLFPCKFYADNVWWRGIVDLAILDKPKKLAWVIDYKTGKNTRYADKGQLELMALAMFKHFPNIETIRGGLLFVVANELITETYTADMQGAMWDKWLADHKQMEIAFANDVWNPNPSGLCKRHCVVEECVYNGRN